jgi:hypothetical protein
VLVNDPTITRNNIHNFAKKLWNTNGTIAKKLTTSGAKNYIVCSKHLYRVDANTMKQLVLMGADVNYQQEYDLSFLTYLTCYKSPTHCHLKKMAVALQLGADVNGGKGGYDSPLTFAIKQKNNDKIKLLLKYNPQDKGLYAAIEKGDIKILDLLLQNRADPNAGLSIALRNNELKHEKKMALLQYFLDNGAVPNHSDIIYAHKETLKNLDKTNKCHQSYNTTDIVELLCKYGAYNKKLLQDTYAIKEKFERIVHMLEKNKPYTF